MAAPSPDSHPSALPRRRKRHQSWPFCSHLSRDHRLCCLLDSAWSACNWMNSSTRSWSTLVPSTIILLAANGEQRTERSWTHPWEGCSRSKGLPHPSDQGRGAGPWPDSPFLQHWLLWRCWRHQPTTPHRTGPGWLVSLTKPWPKSLQTPACSSAWVAHLAERAAWYAAETRKQWESMSMRSSAWASCKQFYKAAAFANFKTRRPMAYNIILGRTSSSRTNAASYTARKWKSYFGKKQSEYTCGEHHAPICRNNFDSESARAVITHVVPQRPRGNTLDTMRLRTLVQSVGKTQ